MKPKLKNALYMVMFIWISMILVGTVLTVTKGHNISIEVVNVEKANADIEGFYDMYSKALTQHSRDLTIARIKKQFKGFDAVQITDLKYRNFLINTRDN